MEVPQRILSCLLMVRSQSSKLPRNAVPNSPWPLCNPCFSSPLETSTMPQSAVSLRDEPSSSREALSWGSLSSRAHMLSCVRAPSLSRVRLCNPMDCSPPGSSVHAISQARILEWVAISSSRGFPNPGIEPESPALQADFFTH